jgi:hypothetical protein
MDVLDMEAIKHNGKGRTFPSRKRHDYNQTVPLERK